MPVGFLFLIVLPTLEIGLFVLAASTLGLGETLVLTLATSFFGAFLIQRQGLGRGALFGSTADLSLDNFRRKLLRYLAGILLIIPGFLTDLAGIALLFPFGQRLFLAFWRKRIARRTAFGTAAPFDPFAFFGNEFQWPSDAADASAQDDERGGYGRYRERGSGDSAAQDDIIDVDFEVKPS